MLAEDFCKTFTATDTAAPRNLVDWQIRIRLHALDATLDVPAGVDDFLRLDGECGAESCGGDAYFCYFVHK